MKKRIISALLCALMLLLLCACTGSSEQTAASASAGTSSTEAFSGVTSEPESLKVHFIDVGQGDAILAELPGGGCMLIDCGEKEYAQKVGDYISALGYSRIDILLITHPHTDHMGAAADIIGRFDIGTVSMPRTDASSYQYENMLKAISEKGLKIKRARAGVIFQDTGDVKAELLAPVSDTYSDYNDYSAVMMLTYDTTRMLFMGDATKKSESELTGNLKVDLVKVGHHGSSGSSGDSFVQATMPDYAVISVGAGNSYSHPAAATVRRWEKAGAMVLRTDLSGTLIAESDGTRVTVSTADGNICSSSGVNTSGTKTEYVLNTRSRKIHSPDCPAVGEISKNNFLLSGETIDELIKQGYTVCGTCEAGENK